MNNEDKEFELIQNDELVASASGFGAWDEIMSYAAQYGQDGPLGLYEVTRKLVDMRSLAAPAVANAAPELPTPFFYYESNADGSVAWNEGCVCVDDVYTNAEYAKENGTHGGKVYSEAQMCAAVAAAAPNAGLVEALRDMLSGWRYIRASHGDLYGVGWDRAQSKAEAALAAAEVKP